jgi:hypothetical protein
VKKIIPPGSLHLPKVQLEALYAKVSAKHVELCSLLAGLHTPVALVQAELVPLLHTAARLPLARE